MAKMKYSSNRIDDEKRVRVFSINLANIFFIIERIFSQEVKFIRRRRTQLVAHNNEWSTFDWVDFNADDMLLYRKYGHVEG